ncbi:MAG: DUF3592 domain-containing protein [Blastocatellia bacterium]|nr:DUF3592 domain-containing protein [Blastocatellia bacterium]
MRTVRVFGFVGNSLVEFLDSLANSTTPRNSGTILLVLGTCLIAWCLWEGEKQFATKQWPQVSGLISTVGEKTVQLQKGTLKRPLLQCSYVVNGATYQTEQVSLGLFGGRRLNEGYTLVYYVKGRNVTVYYNPTRPGQGILEPGIGTDTWLVSGVGIIAMGIGFLLLTVVHKQDLSDLGEQ